MSCKVVLSNASNIEAFVSLVVHNDCNVLYHSSRDVVFLFGYNALWPSCIYFRDFSIVGKYLWNAAITYLPSPISNKL